MVGPPGVEPRSSSYKLRALPLCYEPTMVVPPRIERGSPGYQPSALPLSYETVVGALGIEPRTHGLKARCSDL